MSLTSTTLTDFQQPDTDDTTSRIEQAREQALEGGARYRNPITTTQDDAGEHLDAAVHECLGCGRTISPAYHRAQSDNDGRLWHCGGEDGCVTQTAMKNGAGAVEDFDRRCEDTGDLGGGF